VRGAAGRRAIRVDAGGGIAVRRTWVRSPSRRVMLRLNRAIRMAGAARARRAGGGGESPRPSRFQFGPSQPGALAAVSAFDGRRGAAGRRPISGGHAGGGIPRSGLREPFRIPRSATRRFFERGRPDRNPLADPARIGGITRWRVRAKPLKEHASRRSLRRTRAVREVPPHLALAVACPNPAVLGRVRVCGGQPEGTDLLLNSG